MCGGKIRLVCAGKGPVLQYAKQECTELIETYSCWLVGEYPEAEREIVLLCGMREKTQDGAAFRIEGSAGPSGRTLTIAADTERGILAGVYYALERMGLYYQMNGVCCEGMLDIAACDHISYESAPFLRHRGIRQHINFPMDISSYHIEDAKEYIRNLARMGMNSITFHSYTGQWHGYQSGSARVYAGNFFYGQRHPVPECASASGRISNEKFYCIPEIEERLGDEKARHAFSIRWLNRLMEVCKQTGFHIVLSMELPAEESEDGLVEIVRGVLQAYPLIDTIEWISPEGGGVGESFGREELEEKVRAYFGDRAVNAGELSRIPEVLPEALPGAMASLRRAVDLYGRREEILAGMGQKRIAIGLYVMCRETLRLLKEIMVSVLPGDVLLTFLPAHGSLAAAENIAYMEFTEEQLQRTLIYSWIEFDGNMYLQQNGGRGIEAILEQTAQKTGGKSVYGMCFNHWRTAENEVTAGYMAKASVCFRSTDVFYRDYARALGIGDEDAFAGAMRLLEEVDCYCRDHLFNIGFCYLGCWLMFPGVGWIRGWKQEDMRRGIEMYEEVLRLLERCLAAARTQSAVASLRLLINRMQCSILHIRCILALHPVCGIAEDDRKKELTQEQKDRISQRCREAESLALAYIELHMRQMPDRGCQGTAVSYCATILVYIDHIRQYFVYGEETCTHQPETIDDPPPPDAAFVYGEKK